MALNHPLSPGGRTCAILDANTLLAPRLADVLFDLHGAGLYLPRWTGEIEKEFLRNWARVVKRAPKVTGKKSPASSTADLAKAEFRLDCFRAAVGDEYVIHGYEDPQVTSRVPPGVHRDDVHVVAAGLVLDGLRAEFDTKDRIFIVSKNLRHLAANASKRLEIEVLTPGEFIDMLCAAAPSRVGASLEKTVADLTNPPYTRAQLLDALTLHGALKTVRHVQARW